MHINIPQSAYPVTRLSIKTPKKSITSDFIKGTPSFDFELPEGVDVDDVEVSFSFLGNDRQAIAGGIIKQAVAKPEPEPEPEPIVPSVDIPDEDVEDVEDECDCGENAACSVCDPEDEIAESDDE